ncbi:hypothetical protein P3T43_001348 [Paraburkholderia sp. GAS41]|jgi:hypothetical protein
MRTIELPHVERRIHETLIAHAAGQNSHSSHGKVEATSCQSR